MAIRKPQKPSSIAGLLALALFVLGVTASHSASIFFASCSLVTAIILYMNYK